MLNCAIAVAAVITGTGRTWNPVITAVNLCRLLSDRPRVLSSLQATSVGTTNTLSAAKRARPISCSGIVLVLQVLRAGQNPRKNRGRLKRTCLLYTSDAADE